MSQSSDLDLSPRDASIVTLIARFRQASSRQVHELLFHDLSHTPADRALKRLTDLHYLARIERRTVGGARGGSGQYVYTLGRRGFYLHFDGSFSVGRTVNYHGLAVLDAHIALKRLEAAGQLQVAGFSTEPDCWVNIQGDQLMPDYFVDLGRLRLWFEVDMGTESQRIIREKLARYWRAYNNADETMGEWPLIVWLAIDEERAKELRWIIGQQTKEQQQLFRVRTLANLPAAFTA